MAHFDYTYGLNGIGVPLGKPWLVNVIDAKRILADAHQARQAGAQFVMVALHWGQEYQSAATPQQRALAQALLASPDIDFLYGCHVHVAQPRPPGEAKTTWTDDIRATLPAGSMVDAQDRRQNYVRGGGRFHRGEVVHRRLRRARSSFSAPQPRSQSCATCSSRSR